MTKLLNNLIVHCSKGGKKKQQAASAKRVQKTPKVFTILFGDFFTARTRPQAARVVAELDVETLFNCLVTTLRVRCTVRNL